MQGIPAPQVDKHGRLGFLGASLLRSALGVAGRVVRLVDAELLAHLGRLAVAGVLAALEHPLARVRVWLRVRPLERVVGRRDPAVGISRLAHGPGVSLLPGAANLGTGARRFDVGHALVAVWGRVRTTR